jgi:transcriptional regulator with XRE-family HTH domain
MSLEEKELELLQIKKTLKSMGIKQSWVAQQVGIDDSTLSLYFKGKARIGAEKTEKFNEIIKRLGADK